MKSYCVINTIHDHEIISLGVITYEKKWVVCTMNA